MNWFNQLKGSHIIELCFEYDFEARLSIMKTKSFLRNYLYMLYTLFICPCPAGNALTSSTISTFLAITCNRVSNSHPYLNITDKSHVRP